MRAEKRAWAEISLDAIENNIKEIRRYVRPSAQILGVVKADAYGHGYLEVAKTLLENGADALAVAFIDEAIQLRECGITSPILILGHTPNEYSSELVGREIIPSCFSYELAECISRSAVKQQKQAKIHIKVDTGMSRVGFRYCEDEEINQETFATILKIAELPNIEINGIFMHFAIADDDDDEYTYLQYHRFLALCSRLKEAGLDIPVKHCCNSAALMRFPEMHMDMVRPGIILYGQMPSDYVDKHCPVLHLEPAMQFKARITNVKEVPAGVSVSYGRKFRTSGITKIATIPVGYADGYSRILSGKAKVLVHGKLCDVVGNICMDQCMIDVSHVNNIAIGDGVILFGRSDDIELPVESLAEKMGTINYEILCVIGKRIPRVYFKGGRVEEVHNYLLDHSIFD